MQGKVRTRKAWQARLGIAVSREPKLREVRRTLGLSQSQAAAQVFVSARTWCRFESGERGIPKAVLMLFCMANRLDSSIFGIEKKSLD